MKQLIMPITILLGILAVSAWIIMAVLGLFGIAIAYPVVLSAWVAFMVVIILYRMGKPFWEFLLMTFTMWIARRRLKELAGKEDILKKHFKMMSGDEN